jgi:hypothetical protein
MAARYALFPEFREHQETREDVNSAIMGLLAGSQMAIHLLRLTEGSNHLLGEVFPKIPHIKRFNLTTSAASDILKSAEGHLGAMAVPYVLGTHEDYMKVCLKLLEKHLKINLGAANVRSAGQHEKLEANAAGKFDPASLEQFHLLRKMRNCTVHAGGLVDSALENHCRRMSAQGSSGWSRLTGYIPNFVAGSGGRVEFQHRETVAALAITKNLARQANVILQATLPRDSWGEIMMEDLDKIGPGLPKDANERKRKVRGYARFRYSALNFTEQELAAFDAAY